MDVKVLGLTKVDREKENAGVKVMLGDAEFTILPVTKHGDYKVASIAQDFVWADELKRLQKEKEAIQRKKPVDAIAIGRIVVKEREIEEKKKANIVVELIKDWKIEEDAGEYSASLISRFEEYMPDAITGKAGKRTVKYSREAALALCSDCDLYVNMTVDSDVEVPSPFCDWVEFVSHKDVRPEVFNKIPTKQQFAALGKK